MNVRRTTEVVVVLTAGLSLLFSYAKPATGTVVIPMKGAALQEVRGGLCFDYTFPEDCPENPYSKSCEETSCDPSIGCGMYAFRHHNDQFDPECEIVEFGFNICGFIANYCNSKEFCPQDSCMFDDDAQGFRCNDSSPMPVEDFTDHYIPSDLFCDCPGGGHGG